MFICRDYRHWPTPLRHGVVAIGNFDGLHLGHQHLLRQLSGEAKVRNVPAIIMSFEPHPRNLFQPDRPVGRIHALHHKLRLLRDVGLDAVLLQRFNRNFAAMPAHQFIEEVLIGALRPSMLVTGADFRFGHQRGGDTSLLQAYAPEGGWQAYHPEEMQSDGQTYYSSTRLREAIKMGDMTALLAQTGRAYRWYATVVKGEQRGREWGVPTANFRPPALLWPPYGVYAMRGQLQGKSYAGVANWGVRPHYPLARPLLEVHWFDCNETLYGKRFSLDWVAHLRPEQRFESDIALRAQIEQDKQMASKVLGQ